MKLVFEYPKLHHTSLYVYRHHHRAHRTLAQTQKKYKNLLLVNGKKAHGIDDR